jgi:Matrixin
MFSLLAATCGVLGAASCAAFSSTTRDGFLGGVFDLAPVADAHVSREAVLSSAPGTYIERLLAEHRSVLERWPNRMMTPIQVWIDSSETTPGMQPGFPAAVRAAFAEWVGVGLPVRFAFVGAVQDANVAVRWTEHLDRKTGATTWRTDRRGWLLSADVTLATHISNGRPLDERGVRAIALHEIGHLLGLSHSDYAGDIMAPLVRVDQLSSSDRATARLLYSLPAGRVH